MKQGPSHSMDAKVNIDHLNLSHNSNYISISVDLTTGDPWSGTFVVPQSGWWRFTFNPTVYLYSTGNSQLQSYLKVDGVTAAAARIEGDPYEFQGTHGYFSMAINTIQEVNAGQSVTLEWDNLGGDGQIYSNAHNATAHFTGEYLGNKDPSPPVCEYPGTFQYPGSCRQYWACQSDGTTEIGNCCPGVYLPDAEACISEDVVIVESVCHSEDICA